MDSNKIALIIGGLLLAAFLALPLMRPATSAGRAGTAAGGAAGSAASSSGPALTAAQLVGTAWQANTSYGSVTVQLLEGGQCVATPDSALAAQMLQRMAGVSQITGNWTVNGTTLQLNASAGSNAVNITGQIQGQQIIVNGQPATRVQ